MSKLILYLYAFFLAKICSDKHLAPYCPMVDHMDCKLVFPMGRVFYVNNAALDLLS